MENVKVEEVVAENKKRGLSKKILVIGGTILGLAVAAVMVNKKNKDQEDDYIVVEAIPVETETEENSDVE